MKKKKKSALFKRNRPTNFLIALLVLLGAVFFLVQLTDYTRQIPTLTYTTFLKRVENGDV